MVSLPKWIYLHPFPAQYPNKQTTILVTVCSYWVKYSHRNTVPRITSMLMVVIILINSAEKSNTDALSCTNCNVREAVAEWRGVWNRHPWKQPHMCEWYIKYSEDLFAVHGNRAVLPKLLFSTFILLSCFFPSWNCSKIYTVNTIIPDLVWVRDPWHPTLGSTEVQGWGKARAVMHVAKHTRGNSDTVNILPRYLHCYSSVITLPTKRLSRLMLR